MKNRATDARGQRWGKCGSDNGVIEGIGGDETVLYPDYSGGNTNLHIC